MSARDVIDQYETVLSRFGEVVEFDISGLDRLGIQVTSCSLAVDGRFRHHGNGYGTTDEAARVSGLGELAEGVVSAVGWSSRGPTAGPARTADAEERLGGPAWYSYDVAAQIVGPLYPLYREPPRHSISI